MLNQSQTYQRVVADLMVARRAHLNDTLVVLQTLLGEIQNKVPANAVDPEPAVVAVATKFSKAITETIAYLGNSNADATHRAKCELEIISAYMPAMMGEDELRAAVYAIGLSDKGTVMKALKAKYQGKYDGRVAAKIIDTALGEKNGN